MGKELPKQLTPEKCNCGAPLCNRYGFREGMFYQGTGFDKEVAEEIAKRYSQATGKVPVLTGTVLTGQNIDLLCENSGIDLDSTNMVLNSLYEILQDNKSIHDTTRQDISRILADLNNATSDLKY